MKVLVACEESQRVWMDIPGYEGLYQASNYGEIKSLDRVIKRSNGKTIKWKGRILKQAISNGYKYVNLGISNTQHVHVLVASAFLGKRPDGMDVCHNNGDKQDNRVENLRYATRSENNLDKYNLYGRVSYNQSLDENKVIAIRKMLKEGLSQHEIARLFGVCKNTITQIKQGKTYKWVIEEN